MFEALLKTLGAALSIWEQKEARKYIDKKMEIEKAYYAEFNKDPGVRSDAVLDNLEFELRVLAIAFASSAGKPDPQNQ